jgi:DHA1 family bicyclomycin/chloramphenicol resistance-like MFS transporter
MILITSINTSHALWITWGFLPFIIGQVIPTALLYPLCLNFIPQAKGRISSLIQGARLIVTALCLQLAGYFYNGSFVNVGLMISFFIVMVIITLYAISKPRADEN